MKPASRQVPAEAFRSWVPVPSAYKVMPATPTSITHKKQKPAPPDGKHKNTHEQTPPATALQINHPFHQLS